MIHSILLVPFACLTVFFHNLCLGPLWFSSWSGTLFFIFHTFLHLVIIFSQHMPILSQPVLLQYWYCVVFSQLITWKSVFHFNATHPSDHSHLCSLKCHLICFPYRPGLTSMQHAASHTTAVQPSSYNQRLVLIGKQWYQLPELVPTISNSGLHSCISIHAQHVT